MKKNKLLLFSIIGLTSLGSAFGQDAGVVVGHGPRSVKSGTDIYTTYGYLECKNGCQVSSPNPDAATLQALQVADANHLQGITYATSTNIKFADVCRVNSSDPISSVCMTYQTSLDPNNPYNEPVNWMASPGTSKTFLSYDVCFQYFAPTGSVLEKINWPSQCGAWPFSSSAAPGGDPKLPHGVPIREVPPTGDCHTGSSIKCNNPA